MAIGANQRFTIGFDGGKHLVGDYGRIDLLDVVLETGLWQFNPKGGSQMLEKFGGIRKSISEKPDRQ